MEKARVAVFEDHEGVRRGIGMILEVAGHTVVIEAGSMEKALEVLQRPDSPTVDVLVVDGNLSKASTQGSDGQKLTELARKKWPETFVIGNTSESDGVEGADAQADKSDADSLLNIIEALPERSDS